MGITNLISSRLFVVVCVGLAFCPACTADTQTATEFNSGKQQANTRALVQCRNSNVWLMFSNSQLTLVLGGNYLRPGAFSRTWEDLGNNRYRHVFEYKSEVTYNQEPWASRAQRILTFTMVQTGSSTTLEMGQSPVKWFSGRATTLDLSVVPNSSTTAGASSCVLNTELLEQLLGDLNVDASRIISP